MSAPIHTRGLMTIENKASFHARPRPVVSGHTARRNPKGMKSEISATPKKRRSAASEIAFWRNRA